MSYLTKSISSLACAALAAAFAYQAQALSIKSVGAMQKKDAGWEVHVVFSAPVDTTSGGNPSSYALAKGDITGATLFDRLPTLDLPGLAENAPPSGRNLNNQIVILKATGLTAGEANKITITGVSAENDPNDTVAGVTADFTPSTFTWVDTGTPAIPGQVIAIGDEGFDIYSNGTAQWSDFDEITFAYQQVEGDFDFAMRVEFQDFSSRWARAGVMAREVLNDGDDAATQGDEDNPNQTASRYADMHANPVRTFDNDGPGLDAANDQYESHVRNETGGETSTVGGVVPEYPNVWVRLVREGSIITTFLSNAANPTGDDWEQRAERDFESEGQSEPLPPKMFVGPSFGPETANIDASNAKARNTLFLAQYRFGPITLPFVTSAMGRPDGFLLRIKDAVGVALDPATVKVTADGNAVTVSVDKAGDTTTIIWQATEFLQPGQSINVSVAYKDTNGKDQTIETQAAVPPFVTIPPDFKVADGAVNKSNGGFKIRTVQTLDAIAPTDANAEALLAGAFGKNVADLSQAGPGGVFDWKSVINFEQDGMDAGIWNGNANPPFDRFDDFVLGIPGDNDTDRFAQEIVTFIEFPAPGAFEMGFNSDDGFKVQAARNPSDKFAKTLGIFDGGRGTAETRFLFVIQEAGIYPFRAIWYEGNGGANAEWYSFLPDGTRVLINDRNTAGDLRAFRTFTGKAAPFAASVVPAPGASGVAADTEIAVELNDGGSSVDPASIVMTLDGQTVSPAVNKSGSTTAISLPSSGLFAPSSEHVATLSYTAGGKTADERWSFTVADFVIVSTALRTDVGTGQDPGFKMRIHQRATARPGGNSTDAAEAQLAGTLADNDNTVDPAGSKNGVWDVGLINFDQDAGAQGNFTDANGFPDDFIPGIPGLDGSTDNIAAEIRTFAEFPAAGFYTMGFNSDDGFRVTVATDEIGQSLTDPNNLELGVFSGGRGAADTIFSFVIQEAGVYPLRAIWYEGGGGANLEWFSVSPTGQKILLNDAGTPGHLNTFRSRNAMPSGQEPGVIEGIELSNGNVVIKFSGTLKSSASVTGPYEPVAGATSPHSISPSAGQQFFIAE